MGIFSRFIGKKPRTVVQPPDMFEVGMSHSADVIIHGADDAARKPVGGNLVGLFKIVWDEKAGKPAKEYHGLFYSLHPVKVSERMAKIPAHFEQVSNPCTPDEVEAARSRVLARLKK